MAVEPVVAIEESWASEGRAGAGDAAVACALSKDAIKSEGEKPELTKLFVGSARVADDDGGGKGDGGEGAITVTAAGSSTAAGGFNGGRP